MKNKKNISVLMANEGTYPFVGGGVSTWCHILCENLTDIDWHIISIVAEPYFTDHYGISDFKNIKSVKKVPLWGFEDTAEFIDNRNFLKIFDNRKKTTPDIVEKKFIPLFKEFLFFLETDEVKIHRAGEVIFKLHEYFKDYDYAITLKSKKTWDVFLKFSQKVCEVNPVLKNEVTSSLEITTCLRWLYNMFLPITVDVPKTDITHATISASSAMSCIISKFKYNSKMVLTDHGVYARERYIACSDAPFGLYSKRFLAKLAMLFSKVSYLYADVIAPCAHFNARWELQLGGSVKRLNSIDYSDKKWEGTGVVPSLKSFPFIEPSFKALESAGLIESYNEKTEFPWIRTIYNGVDVDRFRPGPKPDHLKGKPTAVALARVFPLKDVLTMIEACAYVKKEIPNIQFIVYGSLKADPPYVKKCEELILKLELTENFNLAGYHSKPNEAFWEGDVSLLSSISEGFPFTVIESMAAGVPVVGTDVGGVKEGIGVGSEACGLVVPPKNPKAFADAVVKILSDERLRSELARKSRERVLKLFKTETSVDAYKKIYENLANL